MTIVGSVSIRSNAVQNRSKFHEIEILNYDHDDQRPITAIANFIKTDASIRTLHVHNCLEMGLCHEGSGILIAGEKTVSYGSGDVTFINRTEVHFSRSTTGTKSRWSWLMFDPLRMLPSVSPELMDPTPLAGAGFNNVFSGDAHAPLRNLVLRLLTECDQTLPHWQSAVRAMVCEVMVHVQRTRAGAGQAPERPQYDRLAPALHTMAESYAEPLKMAQLAELCGVSEPHFRRLCVETLGQSPQQYLLNLRLQMAAALLRTTGRSVLTISLDVGFDTVSSFNRLFLRQFGCPPSVWRRNESAGAGAGDVRRAG